MDGRKTDRFLQLCNNDHNGSDNVLYKNNNNNDDNIDKCVND